MSPGREAARVLISEGAENTENPGKQGNSPPQNISKGRTPFFFESTHLSISKIQETPPTSSIYTQLSALFGLISLPWLGFTRVIVAPERGLPGLGWATWLGPEYASVPRIPPLPGIEVREMTDGWRPILLEHPASIDREDKKSQAIFDSLVHHLGEDLFQPGEGKAARVPAFRFLKDRQETGAEAAPPEGQEEEFPESKGFTRQQAVRRVLDEFEPDFIRRGGS